MKYRTSQRISQSAISLLIFSVLTTTIWGQSRRPKIFISVDMEGISGIGTSKMTGSGGKDYATGRRLMTDEVLIVIDAILERSPAEIVVNDSHGDMQNLLHRELPAGVTYIQGNIKPLGMVQGLDDSFDAVIFLGYHARAGTPDGFLAHTGSGSVKGLWLNGTEVGEGGLNAALAGSLGVPVILAAGDLVFSKQIQERIQPLVVPTKESIGALSCKLYPLDQVHESLRRTTREALIKLDSFQPWVLQGPISVRIRFQSTARPHVLLAIPGVVREDGYTVRFQAKDMTEAYQLIRLMYKYVTV